MAEITKVALKVDNNTSFPNNNNGAITPSILRAFNTNMIDSLVDEVGYTLDSGSWNQQIDALEQFTASASGLTTGSLLITASAAGNVITFTKGNNSTFNVTVATGSTVDITNLNQATASLQTFTASANIRLNNLETTTASLNTSVSNINTFTASTAISLTNLNQSSASQQISIDSLSSKTGSYATTGSNIFTSANTFTSISASSFISASEFIGNGAKITGITASISMPILDEGIPQGNAFSLNFTGSGISAIVVGGTAVISVNTPDSGTINNLTASFNAYTSSTDAKFLAVQASTASLNSFTASFNSNTFVGTASFNSYTSSNNQRVSSLETNSASVNISVTNLNSFTSSQDTKNSTLASVTSSLNTSASLALVTASFSGNTLTFTKGDASTFGVVIPDVSGSTINTGSFATTGSNVFVGNQTITGSLFISGNINMVNGADIVTHHVRAQGSNGLELQTSAGAIIVSMGGGGGTQAGFVGAVTANSISASTINGLGDPLAFSTSVDSRLDSLEGVSGSFVTTSSLNSYTSSTNSRLTNIETTTASLLIETSNLETFSSSALISLSNLNTATASLFTSASLSLTTASFAGNTLTFTKGNGTTFGVVIPDVSGSTINTGSFATTGSNSFNGNQTITGSLILSSSNAVELQVIGNSVFTGSAFGNVVALSITSNTASMDLNLGNYFTLTLADTATTHISASNVQPGVSATLVITTGTNSSASLAPTMLQPSGSAYSATNGSAKKDVLSIVAVASGVPFVVSTKNMI